MNSGPGSLNVLNLEAPDLIKQDNVLYNKYSDAQQFFEKAVNTSFDPCNDFYNYACGSYQDPLSFTVYRDKNYDAMAEEFEKLLQPGYNGVNISLSCRSEFIF